MSTDGLVPELVLNLLRRERTVPVPGLPRKLESQAHNTAAELVLVGDAPQCCKELDLPREITSILCRVAASVDQNHSDVRTIMLERTSVCICCTTKDRHPEMRRNEGK